MADNDVKKIILDLESGFGNSDESKNKVLQLFKGLIFSDDELAKKYISELDKSTTAISKKLSGEKQEESKKQSYLNSNQNAKSFLESIITEGKFDLLDPFKNMPQMTQKDWVDKLKEIKKDIIKKLKDMSSLVDRYSGRKSDLIESLSSIKTFLDILDKAYYNSLNKDIDSYIV